MIAAACLKWVDQRPEATTVLSAEAPDGRFAGVSAADRAALEWALRTRDSHRAAGRPGPSVVAVTVGPAGAEAVLRDALASGADRAIRIDLPFGSPSRAVAIAIASALRHLVEGSSTIWCGDHSFDRGTGSVPAYLAGELGIAQALGLVGVDVAGGADGAVHALRRLDGGRREQLSIDGAAVLSVEGSTAVLRRAPLRSMLSRTSVEVVAGEALAPSGSAGHPAESVTRPYRPRARTYAPPKGQTALERVKSLTAAGAAVAHGETVTLEPDAAADRILAALTEWGYLR